jgi:hypothetical protein
VTDTAMSSPAGSNGILELLLTKSDEEDSENMYLISLSDFYRIGHKLAARAVAFAVRCVSGTRF